MNKKVFIFKGIAKDKDLSAHMEYVKKRDPSILFLPQNKIKKNELHDCFSLILIDYSVILKSVSKVNVAANPAYVRKGNVTITVSELELMTVLA